MFSRGQIFEGSIGGIHQSAKVIAIVDGGHIGWLEVLGTKAPPFELDKADGPIWKLVQHGNAIVECSGAREKANAS
jgi:hypothetical protein